MGRALARPAVSVSAQVRRKLSAIGPHLRATQSRRAFASLVGEVEVGDMELRGFESDVAVSKAALMVLSWAPIVTMVGVGVHAAGPILVMCLWGWIEVLNVLVRERHRGAWGSALGEGNVVG